MATWITVNKDGTVTIEDAGPIEPTTHNQFALTKRDIGSPLFYARNSIQHDVQKSQSLDKGLNLSNTFDIDARPFQKAKPTKKKKKKGEIRFKTNVRIQECFRPHKKTNSKKRS